MAYHVFCILNKFHSLCNCIQGLLLLVQLHEHNCFKMIEKHPFRSVRENLTCRAKDKFSRANICQWKVLDRKICRFFRFRGVKIQSVKSSVYGVSFHTSDCLRHGEWQWVFGRLLKYFVQSLFDLVIAVQQFDTNAFEQLFLDNRSMFCINVLHTWVISDITLKKWIIIEKKCFIWFLYNLPASFSKGCSMRLNARHWTRAGSIECSSPICEIVFPTWKRRLTSRYLLD